LTFDDLAIETKLDDASNVKYEVTMEGVSCITISRSGFETAIPITASTSPTKVQIRRLSPPKWPELKAAVTVQLVEGKPAVTGIQR